MFACSRRPLLRPCSFKNSTIRIAISVPSQGVFSAFAFSKMLISLSKILTLLPLFPSVCMTFVGIVSKVLGIRPSVKNVVLGNILKLANPFLLSLLFMPVVPLAGAFLALMSSSSRRQAMTWACKLPLSVSATCQFLAFAASFLVADDSVNMNEGGVGETVIFGEDMGMAYHSLLTTTLLLALGGILYLAAGCAATYSVCYLFVRKRFS